LDFHRQYPNVPAVTMSMEQLGLLSRLTGQIFGSCITFGSMGQISAPGQIDAKELKEALRFIDKYYH
jgi:3-dehydroquinate dehydratase-1